MPTTTPTSRPSKRAKPTPRSSKFPEVPESLRGRTVAAIGGGTGLANVLRGVKHLAGPEGLAGPVGVVTMTDDGGSSGRLRRELGVLPPGDIRNCLVAVADDEDLLARLFQYRFPAQGTSGLAAPGLDSTDPTGGSPGGTAPSGTAGLAGHSFGNLFLAALTGVTGDFYQAILTAETVLSVRGKVLPATLTDVRLRGRGRSGTVYEGEVAVGRSGEALNALKLDPERPAAFPGAVQALESADLILLGPGSLYTSILPNLLIPGIQDAVRRSGAPTALVLNLMTQPGETDDMSGLDHLVVLEREVGPGLVDAVIANVRRPSAESLSVYGEQGARPVEVDRAAIEARGVRLVEADLLGTGDLIRHDPAALCRVVLDLLGEADRRPETGADRRRNAETA